MQILDWTLLFGFITLAGTISYNAYRFGKESDFLKDKYFQEGYEQGREDGFLQGIEFIDDIIPPKHSRRKKK
jgi:hypothetical protein